MHEGDEMLVALGGELVDHREIERVALGEIDPDLVLAVFEHVIEDRAAPVLGGIALAGRAVFEGVAFVGLSVVPAKAAALEDRVQRIDEDDGRATTSRPSARQRSQKPRIRSFSGRPVRPWLTSQFIRRRRGVSSMKPIMPRNRDVTKGAAISRLLPRMTTSPSSLTKDVDGMVEQIEHRLPTAGTAARPSASPRSAG